MSLRKHQNGVVKKYCRIFNWIKDTDEDFAEVMNDLCLDRITDTNKQIPSITFLMPNSALRKKIIEKAYSDKPEDAANMITSLVLPYGFAKAESFKIDQKKIGNKLRYVFPKASIKSDVVNFEDKLTIKLVNQFTPLRERANIYVWEIVSGEPPNDLNKYVKEKEYVIPKGSRQKTSKEGSYEGGDDEEQKSSMYNPRAAFAQEIERLYLEDFPNKNTYVPVVVLLLQKLIEDKYYDTFLKIRPILDVDPIITFYLLVEPYKSTNYIIDSDIFGPDLFNDIIKNRKTIEDPVQTYRTILDIPVNNNCAIYTRTKELIEIVNNLRNKLLNDVDARYLPEEILNLYKKLIDENKIDTIENVLPESLIDHYKANPYKRLWQDEYRFIIGEYLRTMKLEPERQERLKLFNDLRNNLHEHLPGNDYLNELNIMNKSNYPLTTCIRERIKMMQYFVNSPDFLYVGCALSFIHNITCPHDTRYGTQRLKHTEIELNKSYPVNKLNFDKIFANMSSDSCKEVMVILLNHINDTPNE